MRRILPLLFTTLFTACTGTSAIAHNTVGVIDRAGKTIVPCEYHRVERLANGFFFLERMDKNNPLKFSYDGLIVDGDGKQISLELPVGCTLSKVFLPNSASDKNNANGLPLETILEIHGPDGFGLCRLDGTVILEPKFNAIGTPIQGCFPVSKGNPFNRTTLLFMLNSKTGERVEAPANARINDTNHGAPIPFEVLREGRGVWGYMDTSGKVVIEPAFACANEFATNGLARVSFTRGGSDAYIDKNGKVVSPTYGHADDFLDNVAIAEISREKKYRKGLINQKFEFVLAPDYLRLQRLFKDVYAAQKNEADQWQAITSSGKFLFSLPAGTKRVYSMSDGILCENPSEPGENKRFLMIDRSGRVVRSGDHSCPLHFEFGLAVVPKKMKNSPMQWEVIDEDGHVVQASQPAFFSAVSADRILKHVRNDHFVAAAWKDPSPMGGGGLYRVDHFANFLNDFDLIGMPRAQVEQLLGPSERPTQGANFYWIGCGMCGNSWTGIEIEFDQTLVGRWREVWKSGESQHAASWVTTNMMVDRGQESIGRLSTEASMRLYPKRHDTLQQSKQSTIIEIIETGTKGALWFNQAQPENQSTRKKRRRQLYKRLARRCMPSNKHAW